jgi:RNA polymerase primary sigma factor
MARSIQFEDTEDGIPSYLTRLTQVPLLTAQQEECLTRRAQAGDRDARQKLVEANMRLVINIAKSYRNKSIPLEDLIQEGAIGLMQAAERFDPDRGFRFSTYATHWVRQAIGRAIDNKSKSIRIPAHVSQTVRRIERERLKLAAELGREPTAEQLAIELDIPVAKLKQILQSGMEMLSLDMTFGDGGAVTLGGLITDTNCTDAEAKVLNDEARQELHRIFAELSERERTVMELRFQVESNSNHTEMVAREMNISRERVRQIEIQAIKKLRVLAQQRRLREILNELNVAM